MTELERLQKVYEEKRSLAIKADEEFKAGYKAIVEEALVNAGVSLKYLNNFGVTVGPETPIKNDKSWRTENDYLNVYIGDEENHSNLSVYVNTTEVQINNCCTGTWTKNEWYYWYAKSMVAIMDAQDKLVAYCAKIDRTPVRESLNAEYALDREEDRIRDEERKREEAEKIQAMENAEWIGTYRSLRSYEEGYVKGAEKQKEILTGLYKVIKRTPKLIYIQSYLIEDATTFKKLWYTDIKQMKKNEIYDLYSCYKPVDPTTITINE